MLITLSHPDAEEQSCCINSVNFCPIQTLGVDLASAVNTEILYEKYDVGLNSTTCHDKYGM